MQHELFYSKLKHSVEGSSLLEVISNSSSGENPHRAAAMESIFERSIQERRERVAAGVQKLKTRPPPADPPATDKKPQTVKSAPVQSGKRPQTVVSAAAQSEKKQPPLLADLFREVLIGTGKTTT